MNYLNERISFVFVYSAGYFFDFKVKKDGFKIYVFKKRNIISAMWRHHVLRINNNDQNPNLKPLFSSFKPSLLFYITELGTFPTPLRLLPSICKHLITLLRLFSPPEI